MTQILLVYRRSSGELIEWEDLGSDRANASMVRNARERLEKDDPDVEVVVLSAPDRATAMRTHARYFARELLRARQEPSPPTR